MQKIAHQNADIEISKSLKTRYGGQNVAQRADKKFRNAFIAEHLKSENSLSSLFHLLKDKGTFDFEFDQVHWQDIDGEARTLVINRASKTNMWPMGTHFWLRDNAIIANRLLNLDYRRFPFPSYWYARGKEMLLSALTIISSKTQLDRFEKIISEPITAKSAVHWPHIFLNIESNINGSSDEEWMHKQDAWQMLAYFVHDALERGQISYRELSQKQRKFLSLSCSFLQAIDFQDCPNGGSWEEIEAKRTSVLAWDTALLQKIQHSEHFYDSRAQFLYDKGQIALLGRIPYECPDYPKDSPMFRSADAALIYLLQVKVINWKAHPSLLEALLASIESLRGGIGMRRYENDSYQGLNYYSNEMTRKLSLIFSSPSGNSSALNQFIRRGEIVEAGHEAQWSHFIWQLSSAYAQLAQTTDLKAFKNKQKELFWQGLALITGENEITIRPRQDGIMNIEAVEPFQIPECYNTHQVQGEFIQYPSMHTPLFWSAAECLSAFNHML